MNKLYKTVFLALFLLANLSLWAQKASDYRIAASRGDKVAQHSLGICYYHGYGVTKDYKQAVYWFTKSAIQEYVSAQVMLGMCYAKGYGVTKDYKQAMFWWKKAANHGDEEALYNIGTCYYNGNGVTKDYNQSVYWFTESANKGYAMAQNALGLCYEKGNGVTQDYNQAVYWYTKGANQGCAGAQYHLGRCYDNGQGVTQDYKQAVYWYTKAANQGNAKAQYSVGYCYEFGEGVSINYYRAREFYRKAINNKDVTEITKTIAESSLKRVEEKIADSSTSANNQSNQGSSTSSSTSSNSSTSSSSYSSSSNSSKYSHWPLFYNNPVFGFRFGYAQRAMKSAGSDIQDLSYLTVFGENGVMNGFQAGFFIIPSRKSMLTLTFGLNCELYLSSGKNAQNYNIRYQEINLYAPLDLSFHIPFSRRSALYVHGGLGFDYSCFTEYTGLEKRNEYGGDELDKFNISWECGADLKIKGLILYSNFQKGISTHYPFGFENPMQFDKISVGMAFGF